MVKVLHTIGREAETSQSNIAKRVGISVGKVNYILQELYKKGIVKTERFINSKNRWAYKYILTPKGIKEKTKITKEFVKRKITEYEKMLEEVDS
ncbi:MAG: MarR family EPS-associated transcriptional regulator [Epsilonproteobacteria bacterium]|nr:MarR family EPS-associated transcriptional regulator [Campylobacterota bacterium]